MADAISQIVDSPALAKQMGEESRRLAEHYDHERAQLLHEQHYRKLIKQQSLEKREKPSSWKRVKVLDGSRGMIAYIAVQARWRKTLPVLANLLSEVQAMKYSCSHILRLLD